jgi:hypothetical protein
VPAALTFRRVITQTSAGNHGAEEGAYAFWLNLCWCLLFGWDQNSIYVLNLMRQQLDAAIQRCHLIIIGRDADHDGFHLKTPGAI